MCACVWSRASRVACGAAVPMRAAGEERRMMVRVVAAAARQARRRAQAPHLRVVRSGRFENFEWQGNVAGKPRQ